MRHEPDEFAVVASSGLTFRASRKHAEDSHQDQAESEGTQAPPPKYFSRETEGTVRHMRAVPTSGLCLVCHETTIYPLIQRENSDEAWDAENLYRSIDSHGVFG